MMRAQVEEVIRLKGQGRNQLATFHINRIVATCEETLSKTNGQDAGKDSYRLILQQCDSLKSEIEHAIANRSSEKAKATPTLNDGSGNPETEKLETGKDETSITKPQSAQYQEPTPPVIPGHISPRLTNADLPRPMPKGEASSQAPPVMPRTVPVGLCRSKLDMHTMSSAPSIVTSLAAAPTSANGVPTIVLRPRAPPADGLQPRPKSMPVSWNIAPDIPISPLLLLYRDLSSHLASNIKPAMCNDHSNPSTTWNGRRNSIEHSGSNSTSTPLSTPPIPRPMPKGPHAIGRNRARSISDTIPYGPFNEPLSSMRRISKTSTNDLLLLRMTDSSIIKQAPQDPDTIRLEMAKIIAQLKLSVTSTSVLTFRPSLVAYQLSLIVHSLFVKIAPSDFLKHRPPHHPTSSIQACTAFFNYITRIIESSILEPLAPSDRAHCIHAWIKVASYSFELRNMQSVKAVIAALGTPPVVRLQKTWTLIARKDLAALKGLRNIVSEDDNYAQYRQWLRMNTKRPAVPYLGVWLHDATYLAAAVSKESSLHVSTSLTHVMRDARVNSMLDQIASYASDKTLYSKEDLRELLNHGTFGRVSRRGGYMSPCAPEEITTVLKDLDEDSLGLFVAHWLLSRKWQTERDVDELSLIREPKVDGSHNIATSIITSEPSLSGILAAVSPSHAAMPLDELVSSPTTPTSPPHQFPITATGHNESPGRAKCRASQDFNDYLNTVGLDVSPSELEQIMTFTEKRKRSSNNSMLDVFHRAASGLINRARSTSVAGVPKLESMSYVTTSTTLARPRSKSGPVARDVVSPPRPSIPDDSDTQTNPPPLPPRPALSTLTAKTLTSPRLSIPVTSTPTSMPITPLPALQDTTNSSASSKSSTLTDSAAATSAQAPSKPPKPNINSFIASTLNGKKLLPPRPSTEGVDGAFVCI
ncbi:hypothetical protein SeMB42_g04147 [Synchytrium endobioticum]|uniref:Ras-GEF domain-containing protein n=1 Tax=Synchytrium endobioticum TaxID=286115 RepID=A0A507D0Z5_9FUNG|nr:hypothetical protein SeMB42_g04147 [Synchytrium endobioticum]